MHPFGAVMGGNERERPERWLGVWSGCGDVGQLAIPNDILTTSSDVPSAPSNV